MQPILLRSATFSTTHLRFTVRARTPLSLDSQSGSALRGNFFNALWHRFCSYKSVPTCSACPLHTTCPVSALVAPLREDSSWGQDIPRPYVITPPREGARQYQPGERFSFHLTLIGSSLQLLPYIMLSIPQLEAEGLGLRLETNQGQRGQFQVERVESYHPFTHEQHTVYETGNIRVQVPAISIDAEACTRRAESLDKHRITLRFLTPLRLIDQEHLVKQASFRPLIRRLLERYLALEQHYGDAQVVMSKEERNAASQQAETVRCVRDETQWLDLKSYSSRQRRTTPIGGLVGRATFEGDIEPFLHLLVMGELVHVGKNVVKGNGCYQIEYR